MIRQKKIECIFKAIRNGERAIPLLQTLDENELRWFLGRLNPTKKSNTPNLSRDEVIDSIVDIVDALHCQEIPVQSGSGYDQIYGSLAKGEATRQQSSQSLSGYVPAAKIKDAGLPDKFKHFISPWAQLKNMGRQYDIDDIKRIKVVLDNLLRNPKQLIDIDGKPTPAEELVFYGSIRNYTYYSAPVLNEYIQKEAKLQRFPDYISVTSYLKKLNRKYDVEDVKRIKGILNGWFNDPKQSIEIEGKSVNPKDLMVYGSTLGPATYHFDPILGKYLQEMVGISDLVPKHLDHFITPGMHARNMHHNNQFIRKNNRKNLKEPIEAILKTLYKNPEDLIDIMGIPTPVKKVVFYGHKEGGDGDTYYSHPDMENYLLIKLGLPALLPDKMKHFISPHTHASNLGMRYEKNISERIKAILKDMLKDPERTIDIAGTPIPVKELIFFGHKKGNGVYTYFSDQRLESYISKGLENAVDHHSIKTRENQKSDNFWKDKVNLHGKKWPYTSTDSARAFEHERALRRGFDPFILE